jgi:hypothetical protein
MTTAGHSVRTIVVACVEVVLLNILSYQAPVDSTDAEKTTNNNATRHGSVPTMAIWEPTIHNNQTVVCN